MAAGKSNLLEALGVLSAAVSGRVDDEALLRRGVRLVFRPFISGVSLV